MAYSSNLPCDGDGICMICKKKSAEDETITERVRELVCCSLLCQIASLRTFSLDKLQYWMESASGYALSIFLGPGLAQLCAVLIPVVLALISIQAGESKFVKKLANLSYPRWALEAFVIANVERCVTKIPSREFEKG
ncbi:unnamed protein product [Camellia sinensis]